MLTGCIGITHVRINGTYEMDNLGKLGCLDNYKHHFYLTSLCCRLTCMNIGHLSMDMIKTQSH